MNLKTITALLAFSVLSSSAFAGFLKEGGFNGKQNDDDKVNLLLKKAPGREGSFFAVLMKSEKQVSLYVVDEINESSYSMTPMEVTADGEIGIVNDDPSLVITSAKDSDNHDVFKIMSANSSNNNGMNGFFEFSECNSKYSWIDAEQGQYKKEKESNALMVSSPNVFEREAIAAFTTKAINGSFTIREKFPGMFSINKNSTFATGTETQKVPSAIAIFVKRKDTAKMILVNPKTDTDITVFTKK